MTSFERDAQSPLSGEQLNYLDPDDLEGLIDEGPDHGKLF